MTTVKKNAVPGVLLLLYDCARFGLVLGFFNDRAAVFLSVNALFPVMDFFLLCDAVKYRVYGPLYAAGKAFCVFSAALWTVPSLTASTHLLQFPPFLPDPTALFVLAVLGTDAVSLIIRLFMHNREGRYETQTGADAPKSKGLGVDAPNSLGEIAKCE
jgi:hypothetical protein